LRQTGGVKAELLFLGEPHEVPLVGEGALVSVFQVIEEGASRGADAERPFEHRERGPAHFQRTRRLRLVWRTW
jgi:hypothetical protein